MAREVPMAAASNLITIDLGPLRQRIEERVQSGLYENAGEVIRAGLEALDREEIEELGPDAPPPLHESDAAAFRGVAGLLPQFFRNFVGFGGVAGCRNGRAQNGRREVAVFDDDLGAFPHFGEQTGQVACSSAPEMWVVAMATTVARFGCHSRRIPTI